MWLWNFAHILFYFLFWCTLSTKKNTNICQLSHCCSFQWAVTFNFTSQCFEKKKEKGEIKWIQEMLSESAVTVKMSWLIFRFDCYILMIHFNFSNVAWRPVGSWHIPKLYITEQLSSIYSLFMGDSWLSRWQHAMLQWSCWLEQTEYHLPYVSIPRM